eukprot:1324181-Pyramimonas_sp.AAC.1
MLRRRGPSAISRGDRREFWCKVDSKALATARGSFPENKLMKTWAGKMNTSIRTARSGARSAAIRDSTRAARGHQCWRSSSLATTGR